MTVSMSPDPVAPVGAASEPLVRACGLRRSYASDLVPVRALRGLDLEVTRGELVAVMGPSGCGKSTLLSALAGLESVDEGEITIDGERVDGRSEAWLARFRRGHIGVVFQFFHLIDGVSALDNVAMAVQLGGVPRRVAVSRARDLLDLLGLGDRAGHAPAVLSGGQRQRLAIARALANRPAILLADEPTGALDWAGGAEVLELFRRLNAEGQTIIVVTHSADVAVAATRVLHMRDGRIEEG